MLQTIAQDVQRGIAQAAQSAQIEVTPATLKRLVAEAMPAAVDMTLRGYPNAALEMGHNAVSGEIATARKRITDGVKA